MISPPLRIAHVVAPAPYGGLETVLHGLARQQSMRGHDVLVVAIVAREDHAFVQRLRADGLNVATVIAPGRRYLRERAAVAAHVRAGRADVLHTHGYRADVVAGSTARPLGVPWVSSAHGFTGGGWKNRLYERLQVRSYRRCDAAIAVSDKLGTDLIAAGAPPARVHVVRNAYTGATAPLERAAARALLGIAPAERVIGWIGRIGHIKGPDVLVRALAELPDIAVRASFVGDGPDRPGLQELAAQLGVADRIRWHGEIPDAGRVCVAFDAFVLSSRSEGTPMALLEAIAARVPVVCTRVGGVPAIVGEEEAMLVSPEQPAALARAVADTLSCPQRAQQRAAAAAARLQREFGAERWLDEHERVYAIARDSMRARAGLAVRR